jgi:hypothetical protein
VIECDEGGTVVEENHHAFMNQGRCQLQGVHSVPGLTAKESSAVAQSDMVTLIDAPEETAPGKMSRSNSPPKT